MNWKAVVLVEMLALYAGDVIKVGEQLSNSEPTVDAIWQAIGRTMRHLIAVVLLLALLLVMASAGFGGTAALFGGLITLAWWIAGGASTIQALESKTFPTPTASGGH